MNGNTVIAKSVQSNGFFRKENWLSPRDVEKTRRIILSLKPRKAEKLSLVPYKFTSFLLKFCKFDFKALARSYFFLKLANKLELRNIAEEIFEEKAQLYGIDFYYNLKSDKPVVEWHCDTAYSGRKDVKKFINQENYSIKFFFYLTDVSTDNGSLSYIPKSNKITYALKKGIFEGVLKYKPYWSLSEYRKLIQEKEYYDYIKNLVGEDVICKFLEVSNFEENKTDSKHLFNNEMKKGGAIIFDEAGIHKGSKTKFSDRAVLRFFYKRASCVKDKI